MRPLPEFDNVDQIHNPGQGGLGALNGGIVKIPSHRELDMALDQRECRIDLGTKLLLHLQLQMLECFDEGMEVEWLGPMSTLRSVL
jgi:hypothetical protein